MLCRLLSNDSYSISDKKKTSQDRLANYVFSNNNTYLIEKYESLLIESYSELVLGAYANVLNKVAEQTADRPTYKRWADKLRHMKTIKFGNEAVRYDYRQVAGIVLQSPCYDAGDK